MPDTSAVSHDPNTGRFEIRTDEGTALLTYLRHGTELEMMHTEVPQALEGRGYGAALAEAALDYARQQGAKVRPSCPFVAAYIQRHPAYEDLVTD
ncbi:MAG TPA: GNAT family N-acetyltransferase [Gemmatimonadaceae bacterium]|nr:GNAT family N-acetyltransferase [Gemmatimonadaceae bacterium]